jgi:hypothetical protein
MQFTRGGAAAVLEVGEEHPDSVKKTMRGRWRPAPREARGGSLGCHWAGAAK